MNGNEMLNLGNAVNLIKDAIVRSRLQAAKFVNKELLSLYYGVGKYVSDNSRKGFWGQCAIKRISDDLQKELPGLRGFGDVSLKKMRLFYEAWHPIFLNRHLATDDSDGFIFHANRHLATDDLITIEANANRPSVTDDMHEFRQLPTDELQMVQNIENDIDLNLLSKHLISCNYPESFIASFYGVGFTHHSEILAKEKSLGGRLFYITRCAEAFWTVETLKSHLLGNLYSRLGTMPNNL